MDEPRGSLQPPVFPMHTVPHGFLPRDLAAQACWYLYLCAEKRRQDARKPIESQVILLPEDASDSALPWASTHYEQQRETICFMYQVTPDDLDKYWDAVAMEAARCGLPIPVREYK